MSSSRRQSGFQASVLALIDSKPEAVHVHGSGSPKP